MDLISSATDYLKRLLTSTPDMKILLLDEETMGILAMCLSKTEIMEHEVFLFDVIHKEREVMSHLKAVCFLRPTRTNVAFLQKELADPKYSEYHLFFSNTVSDSLLREIAEADEHELVQQVHEYFVDYFPQHPLLYSLNVESVIALDPESQLNLISRVCDGIASSLLSLKKKPMIRYQNTKLCQQIAQDLGRRMNQDRSLFDFPRSESTTALLLVDRRDDPVTPLLTQWTYAAMVHEYFGIMNHRVDLRESRKKKAKEKEKEKEAEGEPGKEKEKEKEEEKERELTDQIVLSPEQDEFYHDNMYQNWGQLGINAQQAMAEVQTKDQNVRNMQSIDDMKEFIENYPKFSREKGNVAKHVTLMGDLMDIISTSNMMEVSALEQELACRDDHDSAKTKIFQILRNHKIPPLNKLRLVMLYALRYEKNPARDTSRMADMLGGCGCTEEQVGLISSLLKYCGSEVRQHDLFGHQKSWTDRFVDRVSGLKGVENIYTQHKPLLNEIIQDLVTGGLRENMYPYVGGSPGQKMMPKDIIVFVVGGATHEEDFNVHKMNTSPQEFGLPPGVRIVLAGTTMTNSSTFLKETAKIRDLATKF